MQEEGADSVIGQIGDVKAEFGSLVRNKNFMKLFWGQIVSGMGDWIATLALMSLVWHMTNSSLAVGGMLAFRIVPALFSGPLAAIVSDRLDRRKLMIGCDIGRGLLIVAAPFMTRLWGLYLMLFFLEGLTIVWLAARDASIPNLVEESQLTMANSLSMMTTYGVIPFAAVVFSLLMIPARYFTGGSFLANHPTLFAFVADAVTFFVSAFFFYLLHLESPGRHTEHHQGESGFKESITYALRHPFARSLMLGVAMGCIGGGSLYAVGIGYVRDVLGARSDVAFGFLMAIFGIGMIGGVVALQVLVKREEKPWMLRIALLVTGGILVAMSIIHWLPLAYILAAFFGAAFGILFLVAVTMVQERVPDRDRGKAFAAFHAISRIFLVLGAGLSGGIAALVGTRFLRLFGITYQVSGISLALFIAGILIAAVSVIPLGEEKRGRRREYLYRGKQKQVTGDGDSGN